MQKIMRKGKMRKLLSLTLAMCMICSMFIVTPAYAWSNPGPSGFGPGTQQWAAELEFENNSGWSSIKTLTGQGWADEFWLWGYFKKADNYNGLVKLNVKIKRVRDGAIIFDGVFYPNSDGTGNFNTGRISVNPNIEQIQVFFDASTYNATPPGPYRCAYVNYDVNFV